MIDILQGAQDALFAALEPIEGTPAMPPGLGVFQHLPEDTPPPFIVIGAIGSEPDLESRDQFEEVTAEIHAVYRGTSRAPMLAMLHAVRLALVSADLNAPGIAFQSVRCISTEAGEALADGQTYVGLGTFKFFAEPA